MNEEKKLEEWEEICPTCNGSGCIKENEKKILGYVCRACLGTGKISWIDKIKPKNFDGILMAVEVWNRAMVETLREYSNKIIERSTKPNLEQLEKLSKLYGDYFNDLPREDKQNS